MMNNTIMATKIEIKEEHPLSAEVALQNERMFFDNSVPMKTNFDAVPQDDDCVVAIKTEVISNMIPFPNLFSQKQSECFTKHVDKQIKSETITPNNNCEVGMKKRNWRTDSGSQHEREFHLEGLMIQDKKYNSCQQIDHKIEIKEEPWWLETESSSISEEYKFEDFPPAKSSRLCTKAVSGCSPINLRLPSTAVSGIQTSFHCGKDCSKYETQDSNIIEITVEEHSYSEQSGKCTENEVYSSALHSKQTTYINTDKMALSYNIWKNSNRSVSNIEYHESFTPLSNLKTQCLIHESNQPSKYKPCDRNVTDLSHLKTYNLIPEGKKPHQCKTCGKGFTQLSHLKVHNLIHEGARRYQCNTCDKSFHWLSNFKQHNLIHEDKRPYQCKTCDKKFTSLSHLKAHNWIHEDKRPYQCKSCDKSFISLGHLKRHSLNHEGNSPYQCKTCDKSFYGLSSLKQHELIHEGKRPNQCKTCDKSFIQLSDLKRHNLIHEGKRPHQCKNCGKSFIRLSQLKAHNFMHEGIHPYRCKTCDKSFNWLSNLKQHNLIHEGKGQHQCKFCDKSFTQLFNLKRHNLIHQPR